MQQHGGPMAQHLVFFWLRLRCGRDIVSLGGLETERRDDQGGERGAEERGALGPDLDVHARGRRHAPGSPPSGTQIMASATQTASATQMESGAVATAVVREVVLRKEQQSSILGIEMGTTDDARVIIASLPNLHATHLAVGNQIISINGVAVETHADAARLLKEATGEVTLLVQNMFSPAEDDGVRRGSLRWWIRNYFNYGIFTVGFLVITGIIVFTTA